MKKCSCLGKKKSCHLLPIKRQNNEHPDDRTIKWWWGRYVCLPVWAPQVLHFFSFSVPRRSRGGQRLTLAAQLLQLAQSVYLQIFLQLLFWFFFLLFLPSLFWMCRFFAWLGTCEKKQRWRSEKNHFFNCLIAVAFAWCWCCCCLAAWLLHLITLFMAPAATIKLQFMCVSLWHPAPPHFP